MANYVITYNIQVTDVNGDSATTKIRGFVPDTVQLSVLATELALLTSDIAALTNGKVTSTGMTVEVSKAHISAATAPPPTNAIYPSVTDGARLTFDSSGGSNRAVTIPAVIQAAFVTGSNTVDSTNTAVLQLITDVSALSDVGGGTNLYQTGVKVGRHSRRRPTRKHL
jgi:hypothetical protein